jgi:fluoroquinolone resistance protein
MRTADDLFRDLVNDTADEWNVKMASDIGVDVEYLKISTILKENLSNNEDRIHLNLSKAALKNMFEKQVSNDAKHSDKLTLKDDAIYKGHALNKYVIRMNDSMHYVDSIACTGKIIVGMDFSKADLTDSYFCECVFFNCRFTHAQLHTIGFVGCVFNDCDIENADFTGSVFTRCRFIESCMDRASFEYTTISDTIFIASQMMDTNFFQAKILNTGFNDCHGDESSFKDVAFLASSFSICEFRNSWFNNATFMDAVITHSDFTGSCFDNVSATCITSTNTKIDGTFKHILEMNHALFSPSIFEWEENEADGGENDMVGGDFSPFPDPDDGDNDKPWLR